MMLERWSGLVQFRVRIDLRLTVSRDDQRHAAVEQPVAIRVSRVIALIAGLERKHQSLRMLRFPALPSRHIHGQKAERCFRQWTCDCVSSELRPQTLCFVVEEQEVLLVQKPGNTKRVTAAISPRIVR